MVQSPLCHAINQLPTGNTLLVAEGNYADEFVTLDMAVTVKGGYDSSFTSWDPDSYHTVFWGRLTLDHPGCVWGGFRMLSTPMISSNVYWHNITQGTLVRNFIETQFSSSSSSLHHD